MEVVLKNYPRLLEGALLTLEVTLFSVAIGCIIGLFMGLLRLSGAKPLRLLARVYIDFFRGTPLLVQIFIIYYGLPIPQWFRGGQALLTAHFNVPDFISSYMLPVFLSGVIACSLNSGAYIAEIFRAGVQSIEKGQVEAARSLGMTSSQAMRFVVLPQAFKRVVPPLGNEFIAMLKDTSLLSVIGFAELLRQGQLLVGHYYVAFPIYLAVAFIYLIMTFSFSRLVDFTERRLKTGD
ncbi:MAG: amino acid ABC transporter permease [Actinobacteria bacterium]|nr:amino acid ABC transporter permease [Actinomycetota bacterium]